MSIAIASSARFSLRRLAKVFEHECAHLRGMRHEDMPERLRYSLGETPAWAKRVPRLRYKAKAKRQRLPGAPNSILTNR